MTLTERINRGEEAKRLLEEDSLFSQMFDALKREYAEEWQATSRVQRERREELYLRLVVLVELKDAFRRLTLDGRMARREVDRAEREERINA